MRTFRCSFGLIAFLLLLSCFAEADESQMIEQKITINNSDAISMALENNGLIEAAKHMVEAARAEGKARYAPFQPQLSTTYSYTRLDKAPTTTFDMGEGPTTIEMGRADNYEWAFQFVFPIYAGEMKPAIKKLMGINEEIARNNLDIARRGISYGVTEAYYGLLLARKAIDVRNASLKFITEAHSDALKMQAEGLFAASEVLQMEVAKGKTEMELRAARDLERATEMSLAQVLGIEPDVSIELAEPTGTPSKNNFEKSRLIKLTESRNGELKELDLQIKMAEQWIRVTKSGKQPSLNFVSRYTNQGDTPLVSGNGLGDPNSFAMTLQLSWSIYDSNKVAEEKKQQEESLAALKLKREDTVQKLRISVETALDDYVRAIDNIEVSQRNLDSARENFRVLNERYKEGLERSTNLLEGETLLSTASLQYHQSIYDSYRTLARLAMVTGFETYNQLLESISSDQSVMSNGIR